MQVFEFEGFILDDDRRELRGPDGEIVVLKSKAFDTLSVFVAEPGRIIPKEDLMDRVWPDVTVEENNLNQTISVLRRALGDNRETPRFIQTVPRQGYLFMPEVRTVARPIPTPAPSPLPPASSSGRTAVGARPRIDRLRHLAASPARIAAGLAGLVVAGAAILLFASGLLGPSAVAGSRDASIAVLPFENLGPDPEKDYFARGVSVEIIDILSQLDSLDVIDRNSSFSFGPNADARDLGKTLSVRYVLSGTVRTSGDRVRISPQLSSATTGKQIWTRSYERALSPNDLFAIQRLIAEQVAGAMSIAFDIQPGNLIDGVGTRSLEAYDFYLRGYDQLFYGNSDYPAEQLFQRAIDIDPEYADAWAGLSFAKLGSTWSAPTTIEGRARIEDSARLARRVLELDPDLAKARAILGVALLLHNDWINARAELDRAIHQSRSQETLVHQVSFLLRAGHLLDALATTQAVRELDPLTQPITIREDVIRTALGQHDFVETETDNLLAEGPTQYDVVLIRLVGQINARAPDSKILDSLRRISEGAPVQPAALARDLIGADNAAARRVILNNAFHDADDEYLTKPELIAHLAAWAGDNDLVMEIWDQDLRQTPLRTVWMWGPAFADMRQRPEFRRLMRDIKLDDYWQAYGWPDKCRPTGDEDFVCA